MKNTAGFLDGYSYWFGPNNQSIKTISVATKNIKLCKTIWLEVALAHEQLASSLKSAQEQDPYNLANVCIVSFSLFLVEKSERKKIPSENENCTLQMMKQRNQQLIDTLNFDFDHTRRKWIELPCMFHLNNFRLTEGQQKKAAKRNGFLSILCVRIAIHSFRF